MKRHHRRRITATALGLAAGLAGCVSLDELAPPVAVVAVSGTHDVALLQEGRTLYVTTCAKCHAVEPVHRYSASEWREILPEMEDESNFDDAQRRAVRAYVFAALSAPPAGDAATE